MSLANLFGGRSDWVGPDPRRVAADEERSAWLTDYVRRENAAKAQRGSQRSGLGRLCKCGCGRRVSEYSTSGYRYRCWRDLRP